jgi:hypothetical protein
VVIVGVPAGFGLRKTWRLKKNIRGCMDWIKNALKSNMSRRLREDGRTIGHPKEGEETQADRDYWDDILRRRDLSYKRWDANKKRNPGGWPIDTEIAAVHEELYAIPAWYRKGE